MARMPVQDPGELRDRSDEFTLVVVCPGQIHPGLNQTGIGRIRENEALENLGSLIPIPSSNSWAPIEELVRLQTLVFGRRGTTTQKGDEEKAGDDSSVSFVTSLRITLEVVRCSSELAQERSPTDARCGCLGKAGDRLTRCRTP